MVFCFEGLGIAGAALLLNANVVAEFGVGHLLGLFGGNKQFLGLQHDERIKSLSAGDSLAHAIEVAAGVLFEMPFVGFGFGSVVADTFGSNARTKGLSFIVLKTGAVAGVGTFLEGLDIEDCAGFDHHLDVAHVLGLDFLDVLVLEVEHFLRGRWDDIASESPEKEEEERSGEEIGQHDSPERDACREHGYYLGVACHLAGEEDYSDEDKQAGEHVHVVGNERQVVVENDTSEGSIVLEELIHFLGEVEYDGNRQDKHNREEECAKELAYYVPIDALEQTDN